MQIQGLLNSLRELLSLHNNLYVVLHQEAQLPANCTIDQLRKLHEEKSHFVQMINAEEQKRIFIVKGYGKELGINIENIKIDDLIEHCDSFSTKKMAVLKQELLVLIEKIQNLGEFISRTSSSRLQSIVEMREVIDKTLDRQSTYSSQGMIKLSKGQSLVTKSI